MGPVFLPGVQTADKYRLSAVCRPTRIDSDPPFPAMLPSVQRAPGQVPGNRRRRMRTVADTHLPTQRRTQ